MSDRHFQFLSQRSGIKGSVCNEVWANTAFDQIHNWEALNHASRGTCSKCMSCLTSIVCTYTCLCLSSCMDAPATMFPVKCPWQFSYAYYTLIQKRLPHPWCLARAELFLSAFFHSEETCKCVPNIRRFAMVLGIKLLLNFKSKEWKLASEIAPLIQNLCILDQQTLDIDKKPDQTHIEAVSQSALCFFKLDGYFLF